MIHRLESAYSLLEPCQTSHQAGIMQINGEENLEEKPRL